MQVGLRNQCSKNQPTKQVNKGCDSQMCLTMKQPETKKVSDDEDLSKKTTVLIHVITNSLFTCTFSECWVPSRDEMNHADKWWSLEEIPAPGTLDALETKSLSPSSITAFTLHQPLLLPLLLLCYEHMDCKELQHEAVVLQTCTA